MWALGVLLYTVIFGENPFPGKAEILKGWYNTSSRKLSRPLRKLLDAMLTHDMDKRITIRGIVESECLKQEIEMLKRRNLESVESTATLL